MKNYLQTHFTDGLCHIMWFSMGHCIKTKNYSTENDKILIKIDQLEKCHSKRTYWDLKCLSNEILKAL